MVDPESLEDQVTRNTQAIADLTASIRRYRWRVVVAYLLICGVFAVGLLAYRLQGNRETEANHQQDQTQTHALCEAQNDTRSQIIRLTAPSAELHEYMVNALPLLDCTTPP